MSSKLELRLIIILKILKNVSELLFFVRFCYNANASIVEMNIVKYDKTAFSFNLRWAISKSYAIAKSYVHLCLLFDIITLPIEAFVLTMNKFYNTLFVAPNEFK